ncbi:hypothetical protein T492DRAFT_890968 [Pavlovales sp. CCMP2436]|nr:hypothetical protein T492DRAFT_890968 [Pavlovales sp. CCMP2436]
MRAAARATERAAAAVADGAGAGTGRPATLFVGAVVAAGVVVGDTRALEREREAALVEAEALRRALREAGTLFVDNK